MITIKKAVFYIPKNYNDNSQVESSIIEGLKTLIVQQFGGLTIKGECEGFYKSDSGDIMQDINLIFEVGLNVDDINQLEEILKEYKNILNQEALYLEFNNEIKFL